MKTVDQLTELFRQQGLRVTPQRQAIFGLLHGDDRHPTVESIYDAARAQMPTISLKTVYQTVNDLAAMGEIVMLDLGTGSYRSIPTSRTSITTSSAPTAARSATSPSTFPTSGFRRASGAGSPSRRSRSTSAGLCDECVAQSHVTPNPPEPIDDHIRSTMSKLQRIQDPRQPEGGLRGGEPGQSALPLLRPEGRRRGLPRRRHALPFRRRG